MLDTIYWICWMFWAGLPTLTAYPVSSSVRTDFQYSHIYSKWERYWVQYTLGLLSVTAATFTLVGCLCCRRPRRPKGFQDKPEKCSQEFKDGNNIGQESTFEHSIDSLELNIPHVLTISDRVQFEPLPVERIISGPKNTSKSKPLPLSTSIYEKLDSDSNALLEHCHEWFDTQELCVPRDKLKYLREIGHGWFGKVVEGRVDLENHTRSSKNGAVVVRILTEEATTKEKVWFLGEATPYLKLRHQNILTLLGFCLDTDPYLLLFESCSVGDLKGFLLSNHDKNLQETLLKENIPIRIARDIASGLKHMHRHGFVHTDLSARNCLLASDLSAKLGDYGIGVEKYPEDYYVVGDRAIPIRWSAPESIECTDTTIETRAITSEANMWSYAILLWEIATWGDRPYNDKSDEQVIQTLLQLKTDHSSNGTQMLQAYFDNCPSTMYQSIHLCLNINPQKRPNMDHIKQLLLNDRLEHLDFEQRWESLKVNSKHIRSASLQDLRGSIDSDYWTTVVDNTPQQSLFRLGPCEPMKNVPILKNIIQHESGSETEEESWKGRIEKGVYTEKVKQKSKSVTDLMVLVHIDFDSDAEVSMGAQTVEKCGKKKLPATSSDSNLRHSVHTDEFDEALRKLRDPLPSTTYNKIKILDTSDKEKLLTLTMDQAQTPILRLSLSDKEIKTADADLTPTAKTTTESCNDKHVLRLLTKDDPNLPLLSYVPSEPTSCELFNESTAVLCNDVAKYETSNNDMCFSNNFSMNYGIHNNSNLIDVALWNHALESALENKVPGFLNEDEFSYTESSPKNVVANTLSSLDTPRSRKYSAYNADDEFSNDGDMDTDKKCLPNEDEEDRKQLSTPDDEQSSDSGFRDKEFCDEEENLCPSSLPTLNNDSRVNVQTCTDEEQLQALFELDTILDAEYYSMLQESDKLIPSLPTNDQKEDTLPSINEQGSDSSHIVKTDQKGVAIPVLIQSLAKDTVSKPQSPDVIETQPTNTITAEKTNNLTDSTDLKNTDKQTSTLQDYSTTENGSVINCIDEKLNENVQNDNDNSECDNNSKNEIAHESEVKDIIKQNRIGENCGENEGESKDEDNTKNKDLMKCEKEEVIENNTDDEDSSTVSLRSDNSYVSFDIEEEFVTAIRNELREKLPCAQMSVVEPLEVHDEETPSISNDISSKQWDDDDIEESSNQGSGGVGISIRYNIYGTALSPIQEERESTLTSESLISNSRDASIASKESVPSDDVLLVDTQTNQMVLLRGLEEKFQGDDRDTSNGDLSDDENVDYNCSTLHSRDEKSHVMSMNGGAPLPSPEEESKWQQLAPSFPLTLPLPLEDDLMSTSFGTEPGWCSQDEDEEEEEEKGEDEEEEEEKGEDEEDEDNSSSSGEFVWKRYNELQVEQVQCSLGNTVETAIDPVVNDELYLEDEGEDEEEGEEEEFTPSAWNAALAPHRSALRSPDKMPKSGDQKKSVCFKKQRYHCVYEYPKEALAIDAQGETTTTWEPTSYSDWEEMIDEPRLDLYSLDYDDANHSGNEEFFVSSSNRPFQFQSSDSKYVSQFFPGASTSANEDRDEIDGNQDCTSQNGGELLSDCSQSQQYQLGELRHTRDRLKLNLSLNSAGFVSPKTPKENIERLDDTEDVAQRLTDTDIIQDQDITSNSSNYDIPPMVPLEDVYQGKRFDTITSKGTESDS